MTISREDDCLISDGFIFPEARDLSFVVDIISESGACICSGDIPPEVIDLRTDLESWVLIACLGIFPEALALVSSVGIVPEPGTLITGIDIVPEATVVICGVDMSPEAWALISGAEAGCVICGKVMAPEALSFISSVAISPEAVVVSC